MELLTSKLNTILASVGTHSTDEERAAVADRLRFLIIAYGKTQSVAAIQLEHKVFESMGLVAVDKDALAELNANMAALANAPGRDALNSQDAAWLRAGLPMQSHYLSSVNDATIDHEGRTFRIKDPDLQALMDDTEALLSPGGANMDVGLSWSDSLAVVLKRLQDSPREEDFGTLTRMPLTRYRVHMAVFKALGSVVAQHFRTDDVKLVEILGSRHSDASASLFKAFEAEFECEFTHDWSALIEMTNSEVSRYFNKRIEKAE